MPSEPRQHGGHHPLRAQRPLRRGVRRVTCEDVIELLPAIVDGELKADLPARQHVASCLRCQAELVHYRRLLRALHQLRTDVLQPAPGVLTGVLAALEEVGERRAVRSLLAGRRAAYIGGVAVAATAAGTAGALVLVSRSARRRGIRLAG